jgi:hypothetical protein
MLTQAAKNIPPSMEPMLAMTTTQQMLMASRELDQVCWRMLTYAGVCWHMLMLVSHEL